MKDVILLEALRPLEGVKKRPELHPARLTGSIMPQGVARLGFGVKFACKFIRCHSLGLMVTSGAMALISVCLSMEMATALFSMAMMIFLWIDEIKGKGGRS